MLVVGCGLRAVAPRNLPHQRQPHPQYCVHVHPQVVFEQFGNVSLRAQAAHAGDAVAQPYTAASRNRRDYTRLTGQSGTRAFQVSMLNTPNLLTSGLLQRIERRTRTGICFFRLSLTKPRRSLSI